MLKINAISNFIGSASEDEDESDYSEELQSASDSQRMGQSQLDLFVKTMGLSKRDAYRAGKLLKTFGVLGQDTKITSYRHHEKSLCHFSNWTVTSNWYIAQILMD